MLFKWLQYPNKMQRQLLRRSVCNTAGKMASKKVRDVQEFFNSAFAPGKNLVKCPYFFLVVK
jgi:hypothetical protein